MNNNICCEEKTAKVMCVADYEKKITECLTETRDISSSICSTITSVKNSNEDVGTPVNLMENVIANKELATQIRSIANDINRVLFNQ